MPSPQDEQIAIREFARYIGCSDTYVKKQMFDAVRNPKGALKGSLCKNNHNNRPMLLKELALTEWVASGLTIKNKEVLAKVVPLIVTPQDLPWEESSENDNTLQQNSDNPVNGPGNSVNTQSNSFSNKIPLSEAGNMVTADMNPYTAKGLKDVFDAGIKELKYRKELGELVERAAVYKELFEFGQEVRGAFLQMPARIISHIMSCDTEREAKEVLTAEIESILLLLARGPQEKEKDETDDQEPDN